MVPNSHLQVGIDISRNKADFAMLSPDGELLELHRSFANSVPGYTQAKGMLLEELGRHAYQGVDIAIEATSYYWLPLYLQLWQDRELANYQPRLMLLNAGWVRWFKKSLPADHKSDYRDPYYIAERMRSMPHKTWWSFDGRWLALRLRTRLRFHLSQSMIREKNHYHLFLFLAHSAYTRTNPFSTPFGQLSQTLLNQPELLDDFGQLPADEVALRLHTMSKGCLPDPQQAAIRLKQAMAESFTLPETIEPPVQEALLRLSSLIQNLQEQIQSLDAQIRHLTQSSYPEVGWLMSIPGVGPVFASAIAAEIAGLERFTTPLKWDKHTKTYRPRKLSDVEDAVAKYAGLWWPQNDSGEFCAEERSLSKRGNAYLRYHLIQAADHMRQLIPSYDRFYARKFAQVTKHQHKRALVLTARKAVDLFVGLLHRQEIYRPEEASRLLP